LIVITYNFFLPPGDLGREISNGLAYLILDSTYYDRLIPYETFNEHLRNTGEYPMAVPKVETWILEKALLHGSRRLSWQISAKD
jgi:hypothetical protein